MFGPFASLMVLTLNRIWLRGVKFSALFPGIVRILPSRPARCTALTPKSIGINKAQRIPPHIGIEVNPPFNPNRIGLNVASCRGIVIPLVVIVGVSFLIVVLPRESEVELEARPGVFRVFFGRARSERFAYGFQLQMTGAFLLRKFSLLSSASFMSGTFHSSSKSPPLNSG